MNVTNLQQLPRAVRSRYLDIPDDFFDTVPEVVELRRALDEADEQCQAPIDRRIKHRKWWAELLIKRDEAIKAVAQIDEERPALLTRLLLAGEDMTEDDREQHRRAELARFAERLGVALPAMAEVESALERDVRHAHFAPEGLGDRLRELLERLKVEEAFRVT